MKGTSRELLCFGFGLTLLIGIVLGVHLIDIGQIAIYSHFNLQNSFWKLSGNQVYHIGLYMVWICGVLAATSYTFVLHLYLKKR